MSLAEAGELRWIVHQHQLLVEQHQLLLGLPGALLSPLIVVHHGTLMCGSKRAQTLGMMARGTTREPAHGRTDRQRRRPGTSALFEELLAALLFLPWVLDMLFPLWDRKNQTLHDKVSGTIVNKAARS